MVAALCLLAGCTAWRQRSIPQPQGEPYRYVQQARVTPEGGAAFVAHEVRVTQDSVLGWRRLPSGVLQEVRLARAEVRAFEVPRFDPHRSAAAAALVLAALVAAILASFEIWGYT
ncbi:MAG TPA: hypothetical protein VFX98_18715 [Longimicrobiaceae bacterium]|nr:hypothetical protein [Longimicrobiaceae bacterium]